MGCRSNVSKGQILKIVHLITSPSGGAANAALRLNEALQSAGFDSNVVGVERRKRIIIQNYNQQKIGFFGKLSSSATTFIQRRLVQKGSDTVSTFSLNLLKWENKEIASADVLHLHAFYNLVSVSSFLTQYPDKVKIITLHDERFYTGGCHYSYGCEFLTKDCINCPQVRTLFRQNVSKIRKKVLREIRHARVTFICPSDWIRSQALAALPEVNPSQFKRVFNPIPSSFTTMPSGSTTNDIVTFGFIAQNLQNPIKNLDLLLRAFLRISDIYPGKYKLKLIGFSSIDFSSFSPHISRVGLISNAEIQELFLEIDALVVPSTHDNLPNVLGEALMSGVGLIGSDVGGIPEVLELFGQQSFMSGNLDALIQALLNFQKPNREELRLMAEAVFGYEVTANLVAEIYRDNVS